MKMRGAVLYEQGLPRPYVKSQPLKIETLDLEGPRVGEGIHVDAVGDDLVVAREVALDEEARRARDGDATVEVAEEVAAERPAEKSPEKARSSA